MRNPMRFLLVFSAIGSGLAAAQSKLPTTPIHEVTENYFGTKVRDPYRWLENTTDAQVVAWMKAQNDFTRATLANIPGRDQLMTRIKALDNAGTVVSALQVWGGRYFYFKTEPGSDNRKLYVRDKQDAPDRLLVDTEKLTTADGKHFSIDYFQPSLDGKYVAYGVSPGGSEESILHVIESATGKVLSDTIDRAQFGQPTSLPDGSFFYTRTQKLAADAPPTAKFQKLRCYHHVLGADPDKEVAIFGYQVSPEVKVTEDDFPVLAYSPGAPKHLVGLVIHGVKRELDLYATAFKDSVSEKTAWKKVVDDNDAVITFDVHGDSIFLVSHKDASRYRVLRTSLENPNLAQAATVVPESEVVVVNIAAADDALYVQDLDGGIGRLQRLPYRGATIQPVKLAFDGAIQALVTNPTETGAWLELTS